MLHIEWVRQAMENAIINGEHRLYEGTCAVTEDNEGHDRATEKLGVSQDWLNTSSSLLMVGIAVAIAVKRRGNWESISGQNICSRLEMIGLTTRKRKWTRTTKSTMITMTTRMSADQGLRPLDLINLS